MATKKSSIYGCRVPAGGTKRGCGGGAKVVSLEKEVEKLHKRLTKNEEKTEALRKEQAAAKHEANRRALEKSGREQQKKDARRAKR